MFNFLTIEQVHLIHREGLRRHGGKSGVRDLGMIESAIAAAENAFLYGNGDGRAIAAAYAFHLAEAQAYIDGNKRVGLASAITFLAMNHSMPRPSLDEELLCYEAMIAIAKHEMTKAGSFVPPVVFRKADLNLICPSLTPLS